jgi:hypothetical protein
MKKLFGFILLAVAISAPAFAGDVVGHSTAAVGKDFEKVATVTAKDSVKAGVKVVKFLF